MTDGSEVAARVVDALESMGINYFLAGSHSSNHHGIPHST